MQREQVIVPKMLLYILFATLYYALQSSIFGMWSIRGFHIDLLPCFVAAAALLDGPMEGVIIGVFIGVLYDASFTGIDGVYPILFLVFGLLAGIISREALSRNYVSMMMLTATEMLLVGLFRYFVFLRKAGASFSLVMQQIIGGIVLACIFGFIIYLVMKRITKIFETR